MKTLSDFKRKLTVGTKVNATFLGRPLGIIGNLGNMVLPPAEPREQTVDSVQSNSITFKRADNKLSWLTFPKAKHFRVVKENTVIISDELGRECVQYEFI